MELSIKNLEKNYDNNKVLKDINLSFEKDKIVFIVGKSGSGKSTLLSIIGGMENESSGTVTFTDGEIEIDNHENDYISSDISFVFQDFNLIMGLSIIDNIKICLSYSKIKYDDEILEKKIKEIGLKNPYQIVDTLSGGEKQRVAILRAYLKKSKIILADEPTGNLDSENSKMVFEYLSNLKKERIVIIVTHDLEFAEKYGDRIITLSDGKVIDDIELVKENNYVVDVLEQKKQTINFAIFKLMFNSIKKHKIRSMLFLFILLLCIVFLSISINLYTNTIRLNNSLNVDYLEADLVTVFYDEYDGMDKTVRSKVISDDVISDINANGYTAYSIKKYGNNNYSFTYANKAVDSNVRLIDSSDYLLNRFSTYDILGDFPKNKYEVVLSLDTAIQLFNNENDALGKTIGIIDGNGHSINLIIKGINRTQGPSGKCLSFISNETVKELEEMQYSNLENPVIIERFRQSVYGIVLPSLTRGHIEVSNTNVSVMYGSGIVNKNDLLIPSFLYNYLSSDDKKSLFEDRFYISGAVNCEVHISGVYESNDDKILATSELIEDLTHVDSKELNIYLKNYEDIDSFKNSIKELDEKLLVSSVYENLKYNVANTTKTTQDILLTVSIIFALLSIVMMYSYMRLIIIEKTYEIGILKSFGAKKINIFLNMISDLILVIMIAIVLSFALVPIGNILLKSVGSGFEMLELSYPVLHILIIGISLIFIAIISSFFEIAKNTKKSVSQLLREKNL